MEMATLKELITPYDFGGERDVNVPVISCPPWKDYAELAMNLNSSVCPAARLTSPWCAPTTPPTQRACASALSQDIKATKAKLRAADAEFRVL